MPNVIPLIDFNLGGQADSKYQGPPSSVSEMVGCDIHSEPGIVQQSKIFSRKGAGAGTPGVGRSRINALVTKILQLVNGDVYHFSGSSVNSGIWKHADSGFMLVYYDSGAIDAVQDATEYKNFIFYTHQASGNVKIGYWKNTEAPNGTNSSISWPLGITTTNQNHHPLFVKNRILFFGDGNKLYAIQATASSPATIADFDPPALVLELDIGDVITGLGEFGPNLLLAVQKPYVNSRVVEFTTNNFNEFLNDDVAFEYSLDSFIPTDNATLVISNTGRIYQYDGYKLVLAKRVPRFLHNDKNPIFYPNAGAVYDARSIFAISDQDNAGSIAGIHSFGGYDGAYPRVLSQEFILSPDKSKNILIGALMVQRQNLTENIYASWQDLDGSGDDEFGIDKLEMATAGNYPGAYIVTREIEMERFNIKDFRIQVNYESMSNDADIEIWKIINHGSAEQITEVTNFTNRLSLETDVKAVDAATARFKIILDNGAKFRSAFLLYD